MIPDTLKHLAVSVASLRPHERNARLHDDDAIRDSLARHGQYRAIVVNRGEHPGWTGGPNTVLAGHGTLEAAMSLGWPDIAATFVDVDDDEAARILLVDNRLNDTSPGYDNGLLLGLLQDLGDLEGTGYDEQALDDLVAAVNAAGDMPLEVAGDPDSVPDAPKGDPATKMGDLWLLGKHRLLVGDATNIGDVERLLGGKRPAMVFTDPPYNVAFNGRSGKFDVIANDALPLQDFADFLREAVQTLHAVAEGVPWYICTNWHMYPALYEILGSIETCIVWVKNQFGMGASYRHQHEFIAYVGGPLLSGSHAESDVWEIARDAGQDYEHPTQKPIALPMRAMEDSSKRGDIILDLFGGSGSTLIGAHLANRVACVAEIDPVHTDVICMRYQRQTGVMPILESTGEPVDFMAGKQG